MLLFVARILLMAFLMISFNGGYPLQTMPLLELEFEKEECKLIRSFEFILNIQEKKPFKAKDYYAFNKAILLKLPGKFNAFPKGHKKPKLYLVNQSLWL